MIANAAMNENVAFCHPTVARDLRDMAARERYKMQSHKERYKKRYGHYPKTYDMEVGTIESFLFRDVY